MVFFQTKVLFYELPNNTNVQNPEPVVIIDLIDEHFTVTPITRDEAIHIKSRDVPNVFKV